jgi:hypothetical protein
MDRLPKPARLLHLRPLPDASIASLDGKAPRGDLRSLGVPLPKFLQPGPVVTLTKVGVHG